MTNVPPNKMKSDISGVKALVFDVFGTLVDWRGSIAAEGAAWGAARNIDPDWAKFADAWRMKYRPAMDRVRKREIPWTRLDDLHRMMLDEVLAEFRIDGLSEAEKTDWAHAWRRLKPWPDTVAGLARLKKQYILAPLSNGNIALMADLARRNGFPWDAILGAELVKHYKPDHEVYKSAPYFLDLQPREVMMVAAHTYDLETARTCGLRTAFLHRPDEYGDGKAGVADNARQGDFDVVARDALDLAAQLGC